MDLQLYYKKIRETEHILKEPFVLLVSADTPDGGRAGVLTEVPRRVAAKMIIEGWARAASTEEAREFTEEKAEAKRQADQLVAASRMQFAVVSPSELRKLKGAILPDRDQDKK